MGVIAAEMTKMTHFIAAGTGSEKLHMITAIWNR
jgi:hypothetical protein